MPLKLLEIAGKSMSPFLRPGDRVHVREAKPDDIRCGDIILYAQGENTEHQLKVHRVLLRRRTPPGLLFWTKGDREWHLDSPVPALSVIGIVVGRERQGAFKPLTTPYARLQAFALAAVGIAFAVPGRLIRITTAVYHLLIGTAVTVYHRLRDVILRLANAAMRLANAAISFSRAALHALRIAAASPDYWPCRAWAQRAAFPPAGPPSWRIAPDRFRQLEFCRAERRGGAAILEGRINGNMELSGNILLTGNVEVPEWATLTIRAGSALRATWQGSELSIRRAGRGNTLEFCEPGKSSLVVRGEMIITGEPDRPVLMEAGGQFGGLVLAGAARARLDHVHFSGDFLRSIAVIDSSRADCQALRFEGGQFGLFSGGRARIRLKNCSFDSPRQAAIAAHDQSHVRAQTCRISSGRSGVCLLGKARVDLKGCSLEGQREDALAAYDESLVWLRHSRLDRALALHDKSRARLRRCRFSGSPRASIYLDGRSRLTDRFSVMKQSPEGIRARGLAQVQLIGTAIDCPGPQAIHINSGKIAMLACRLRAPVGLRLEQSSRAVGALMSFGGCSIAYAADGASSALFKATLSHAAWLAGAESKTDGLLLSFPWSSRDFVFRILRFVRGLPFAAPGLLWPYRFCVHAARRFLGPQGSLWLRRSWARGEAHPGLSDLDLLLSLNPAAGDPIGEIRRLKHIARLWKGLRLWFPFLGEPILAEEEDIRCYGRHGDSRAHLEIRDWKHLKDWKLSQGLPTPTVPMNHDPIFRREDRPSASSLRLGLDQWTEGFEAYVRLVATAAEPATLRFADLWKHRGGRAWARVWRHGRRPFQTDGRFPTDLGSGTSAPYGSVAMPEPPSFPLPENSFEACAAALEWIHAGAREVLAAIHARHPEALRAWTLEADSCLPLLESGPADGFAAALEDPGHLTYLILSSQDKLLEQTRCFQLALYLRARHDFLRSLGLPVTPEVLSLALCGPYRDWPYQAHQSGSWPRYGAADKTQRVVLQRWASEEDAAGRCELERELLVECFANLRLHWRGRLLQLVGAGDSCSYFLHRFPALVACLRGEKLPQSPSLGPGLCPCQKDFDGQAARILDWIRELKVHLPDNTAAQAGIPASL